MKKLLFIPVALLLSTAYAQGTATAQTAAPVQAQSAPAPFTPPPVVPQVHIVVGGFKCASYSCNGDQLADALTNALMQTGRFAIYERAQLAAGMQEGMLQGADAGSQVVGADVMVSGLVTSFGEDASSGSACLFGICMGSKEQRVTATLRIFDIKSSRIIGTTQVEGKSSGTSGSLNFAGLSLGGSKNSGMDKAVAAMLNDAVQKLSATIPANYYH
ncbi:CsgG/HfaB family protein [Deinococcus sp.]|uniref:CsgG/HfaB family protein n=1 Tax=Deinococcus sp. TaxID=47478 RepID=UPI0025C4361C|nr:CsgG/HfaB family protein [Deinococcus sp.]